MGLNLSFNQLFLVKHVQTWFNLGLNSPLGLERESVTSGNDLHSKLLRLNVLADVNTLLIESPKGSLTSVLVDCSMISSFHQCVPLEINS